MHCANSGQPGHCAREAELPAGKLAQTLPCPHCGARNDADARFCNHCGKAMTLGTA